MVRLRMDTHRSSKVKMVWLVSISTVFNNISLHLGSHKYWIGDVIFFNAWHKVVRFVVAGMFQPSPKPGSVEVGWVYFWEITPIYRLISIVWPALPQGKCLQEWKCDLFLTVFLFLRLWRDFCPASRRPVSDLLSAGMSSCWMGSPPGHPSWWCAGPGGLASTATGWWRDFCPHPPLPDSHLALHQCLADQQLLPGVLWSDLQPLSSSSPMSESLSQAAFQVPAV